MTDEAKRPEADTSAVTDAEVADAEAHPEPQPTDAEADASDLLPEIEPAIEEEPDPNAVAITLNGREIVARKGETIIAAADREGEYIPRFCYHPRMSAVGMCRQCMVEVDTGRGPMLQPSCMITVSPEMKVETESPIAKRAQEGMLELLLANHPLDCPVCDKGGECPLQDQAFSHGPGESRFVEQKRNYEKPIALSEHVLLDRERCILCDRCTRFADEVAGDKLIHFIDRGNATQVNTFPDEPFSSYFSGNTVQICPVGALTAKPYRFKARPWDLDQVESTCTTCSVGCRISVQSSRDQLLRFQGVDTGADSDSVNWGWMCDRGRFNFESIDSDLRIESPRVRGEAGLADTSWNAALRAGAATRRRCRFDRVARRCPQHERGCLRLGPTRRPARYHPSRRPTRRRPARRGARPAARHDQRGGRCGDRDPGRTRPQRRAAGALSEAARCGSARSLQDHRIRVADDRYHPLRLAQRAARTGYGAG